MSTQPTRSDDGDDHKESDVAGLPAQQVAAQLALDPLHAHHAAREEQLGRSAPDAAAAAASSSFSGSSAPRELTDSQRQLQAMEASSSSSAPLKRPRENDESSTQKKQRVFGRHASASATTREKARKNGVQVWSTDTNKTRRANGLGEKFYIGVHRPVNWEQTDMHFVRKHGDSASVEDPEGDFHDAQFTHVVHATHTQNLNKIKQADGSAHFRGQDKSGFSDKGSSILVRLPLFWLSPDISKDIREGMSNNLRKRVSEQLWSHVHSDLKVPGMRQLKPSDTSDEDTRSIEQQIDEQVSWFLKSPAFGLDGDGNEYSRYGPHGIRIAMPQLLDAMGDHWGVDASAIEFRVMGTFTYNREHMHTVMLCPPSIHCDEDLSSFPALDEDATFSNVLQRPAADVQPYTWRVRATTSPWEHLTFACLLKPGEALKVNDFKVLQLPHKPNEEPDKDKYGNAMRNSSACNYSNCIPSLKRGVLFNQCPEKRP